MARLILTLWLLFDRFVGRHHTSDHPFLDRHRVLLDAWRHSARTGNDVIVLWHTVRRLRRVVLAVLLEQSVEPVLLRAGQSAVQKDVRSYSETGLAPDVAHPCADTWLPVPVGCVRARTA